MYLYQWGPDLTVGSLYHTFHYGRLEVYKCIEEVRGPSYFTTMGVDRKWQDGQYLTYDELLLELSTHEHNNIR